MNENNNRTSDTAATVCATLLVGFSVLLLSAFALINAGYVSGSKKKKGLFSK